MTGWLSTASQEHAFGRLGEPGNPSAIEHNARGLCALLAEWLGFALELRSIAIPSRFARLRELALALNDEPIRTTYTFIVGVIGQMEAIPRLLAERVDGSPIRIELTLTLKVSDDVSRAYDKEIKRLRKQR